jgi:hypothetical protein
VADVADRTDHLLEHLLDAVLSVAEEHSITVIVGGSIISGVAIPAATYYESLDSRMADALGVIGQDWPAGAYASLGERFGEGLPNNPTGERRAAASRFLHLRDAEIDAAGSRHLFRFLRVRIADISAWDVGAREAQGNSMTNDRLLTNR